MQPEACCWQRLQRRAAEEDEDRHHRVGSVEPTKVRSLTRHKNLVQEATQAQNTFECFWQRGVVPRLWTLQDTKLGFWRQLGNGVLTEDCPYIFGEGSGTHSDPRIRSVEWAAVIIQGISNCLGQTWECWKRHSERLMNSLKPTGGWMACVVDAEHARQCGIHYRLRDPQEKAGCGLAQTATSTSGGECPEP